MLFSYMLPLFLLINSAATAPTPTSSGQQTNFNVEDYSSGLPLKDAHGLIGSKWKESGSSQDPPLPPGYEIQHGDYVIHFLGQGNTVTQIEYSRPASGIDSGQRKTILISASHPDNDFKTINEVNQHVWLRIPPKGDTNPGHLPGKLSISYDSKKAEWYLPRKF